MAWGALWADRTRTPTPGWACLMYRGGILDHLGRNHADDQANHPPVLPQKRTAALPRGQAGLIVLKFTVGISSRTGPKNEHRFYEGAGSAR